MINDLVSQKLPSLRLTNDGDFTLVPFGYEGQEYRIMRIKLSEIRITEKTRDQILMAMDGGKLYVQLDKITLMVNTISAIEPYPLKNQGRRPQDEKLLRISQQLAEKHGLAR